MNKLITLLILLAVVVLPVTALFAIDEAFECDDIRRSRNMSGPCGMDPKEPPKCSWLGDLLS